MVTIDKIFHSGNAQKNKTSPRQGMGDIPILFFLILNVNIYKRNAEDLFLKIQGSSFLASVTEKHLKVLLEQTMKFRTRKRYGFERSGVWGYNINLKNRVETF